MASAPGKSFRKGLTIVDLMDMFPNEDTARKWFEAIVWKDGRTCPHCGSAHTSESPCETASVPYHCHDCGKQFSVRKGTVMEGSPLPFRKWVLAIYLHMTCLKGVSSMKLHRDIGVTQKTAWFMLQRIREAFRRDDDEPPMGGPVVADETYVGGRERNKHDSQKLKAGRGPVGKTAVVGAKDRAENDVRAESFTRRMLQPFADLLPTMRRRDPGFARMTPEATMRLQMLSTMRAFAIPQGNMSAIWRIPTALKVSGRF